MKIVDVRSEEEFKNSHVKGALNIPLDRINCNNNQLNALDKSEHVIVYCNSGNRSSTAKNKLEQCGFTNISNGINQSHVEAIL